MTPSRRESRAARDRRRASRRILLRLARSTHAARLFVPFGHLRALTERLLARRLDRRGADLSPAERFAIEREFHAAHQAGLLRAALDLLLWSSPEGRAWIAPDVAPADYETWCEGVDRALDLALVHDLPISGELLACRLLEIESWPGPRELARAARRLDGSAASAVSRLCAGLFEGARSLEFELLVALTETDLEPFSRARLHVAAALHHERAGELERALSHHERALVLAPGPRTALACWVLATELGDSAAEECAWRGLLATWEGREALGAACGQRIWRELVAGREAHGVPVPAEVLRRTRALWAARLAREASA